MLCCEHVGILCFATKNMHFSRVWGKQRSIAVEMCVIHNIIRLPSFECLNMCDDNRAWNIGCTSLDPPRSNGAT